MSQQLINEITKEYMKNDVPEFRPGDTVKVYVRIKEGENFEKVAQDVVDFIKGFFEKFNWQELYKFSLNFKSGKDPEDILGLDHFILVE